LDNLTHSLAGWALGQAGLKTRSRKGLAALILGANMPDIDVFFGNAPWGPLAMHRGFTHGLVGGVILLPPVLAGLLWLLDRWQVGRGTTFKSGLPMHFGWLVALAYIGTLTHPFLDMLTTYSVQLFSPLSKSWYHADALFIIDIWVWLVLGISIVVSRRREQAGREWRRLPQAAIGLVVAYIAANLFITEQVDAKVREYRPQAQAIFASPPPFWSWQRDIVWREAGCYGRASYRPFGAGFVPSDVCEPTNMGDPEVRLALSRDPNLAKFLKWSILPQAEVSRGRCATKVTIGDARYGELGKSRLARETIIANPGACLDNSPPRS
jgi:inner membrane protein